MKIVHAESHLCLQCFGIRVICKQERERKHFQEVLKLKMKQHKAELDRISRGQPKEVKQQRRAEQEAEIAKKAR